MDKHTKWIGDCLRTVPAGDVNFTSALGRATVFMLQNALQVLKTRPKGNLSRITAIRRELRRRGSAER